MQRCGWAQKAGGGDTGTPSPPTRVPHWLTLPAHPALGAARDPTNDVRQNTSSWQGEPPEPPCSLPSLWAPRTGPALSLAFSQPSKCRVTVVSPVSPPLLSGGGRGSPCCLFLIGIWGPLSVLYLREPWIAAEALTQDLRTWPYLEIGSLPMYPLSWSEPLPEPPGEADGCGVQASFGGLGEDRP